MLLAELRRTARLSAAAGDLALDRDLPNGWSVDLDDATPSPSADLFPASWYSAQPRFGHPMLDAPLTSGEGGTVYLDRFVDRERLEQALSLLRVLPTRSYVVYADDASDPARQRYLTQLRIIPDGSAPPLGVPEDHRRDQPLTIAELLWRFMDLSRADERVYGAYGEDGDEARAEIAFGLWVENADWGVLRVWSRPVLYTK